MNEWMASTSSAEEPFSPSRVDIVRNSGPDAEYHLSVGDALASQGNITQALDAYSRAFGLGGVPPSRLSVLVSLLVAQTKMNLDSGEVPVAASYVSSVLSCRICGLHWADPVTIKCGHTFCRACLEQSLYLEGRLTCGVCKIGMDKDYLAKSKTNILLSQILQKCFPEEITLAKLKVNGNQLLSRKQFSDAVKTCTEAIENAPNDVHLRNLRSVACAVLGLFQEALWDADVIVQLRPNWAQGYYRKAVALRGMSLMEESVRCYLLCLSIDSTCSLAKTELTQVLYELLSRSSVDPEAKGSVMRCQVFSSGDDGSFLPCAAKTNSASASGLSCLLLMLRGDLLKCEGRLFSSPVLQQSRKSCFSFLFPSKKRIPKVESLGAGVSDASCSSSEAITLSSLDLADERLRLATLSTDDLECSLCSSLLLRPVTTDCGHVFCCECLYRSLDYRNVCPLCKESLAEFLAEQRQAATESVERVLDMCFAKELRKRIKLKKQELSLWYRSSSEDQAEIPIFVCALAYPGVTCPLHVFEPRYRLMIRRCVESGLNQFGMCVCLNGSEENFAEFGTQLLVQNVRYFPDGRSVIDTVGGRRFRVLSRGLLDGHRTAKVTYLSDETVPSSAVEEVNQLQLSVHEMSLNWFTCLPESARLSVLQCYGKLPSPELEYSQLSDGPAWVWYMTAILPIQPQTQLKILSMLSLRKRLVVIQRVLSCIQSNTLQLSLTRFANERRS